MSWKETSKMAERQKFINKVLKRGYTFKNICREFKIITKTGYKWYNRFKEDGYGGLIDQSKRPLSHPSRLSEEVTCDIIALKLAHISFGPK